MKMSDEPLVHYVEVPMEQRLTKEQEAVLSKGLRFQIVSKKMPNLDKYVMELAKQVNTHYCTNKGYLIADNVFAKLEATWERRRIKSNLTFSEYRELLAIKRRKDIVIKPSDKNMGVTVMSKQWYYREAMNQLNNGKYYERVEKSYILGMYDHVWKEVNRWYKQYSKYVNMNEDQFMGRYTSSLPKMYIIPKIHKSPVKGRPIIALVGFFTTNLAKWVDKELQDIIEILDYKKLIVKGSKYLAKDIIQKNEEEKVLQLKDKYRVSTLDFNSLYTNLEFNMIQDSIMLQVLEMLPKYTDKYTLEHRIAIVRAVMTLCYTNYFRFEDTYWKQICGIPMGGNASPNIANLVLLDYERRVLSSGWIYFYKRYLDDVLIIHDKLVDDPADKLYDKRIEYEYTSQCDYTANFLDFKITISSGIETDIYEKPGNAYEYARGDSNLPKSSMVGIAIGILHRLAIVCDTYEKYKRARTRYMNLLKGRGYDQIIIGKALEKVSWLDIRKSLSRKQDSPKRTKSYYDIICHIPYIKGVTIPGEAKELIKKEIEQQLKVEEPKVVVGFTVGKSISKVLA